MIYTDWTCNEPRDGVHFVYRYRIYLTNTPRGTRCTVEMDLRACAAFNDTRKPHYCPNGAAPDGGLPAPLDYRLEEFTNRLRFVIERDRLPLPGEGRPRSCPFDGRRVPVVPRRCP